MIGEAQIRALLPHGGRMCLLDRVDAWDATTIRASACSHLDPLNPLRRSDGLPPVCGTEYGLQAAALHGALLDGERHAPGLLAGLNDVRLHVHRLDDPALGRLDVQAECLLRNDKGLIYRFAVRSEAGGLLIEGRATVILGLPPRADASSPPTGGAA